MIVDESLPTPTIESIDPASVFVDGDVTLQVLRLDRIHPLASGNKVYKLQGWLQEARRLNARTLISVGGAHSNHLHAMALVARASGFASAAVVRYQADLPLTPTLRAAQAAGMQLHFVSGDRYRDRHTASFPAPWLAQYPDPLWIPEGGHGMPALWGTQNLMHTLNTEPDSPDVIAVAAGSGTFAAGLLTACKPGQQVAMFAMARDPNLPAAIADLARQARPSDSHADALQFFAAVDGRFGYFDAALLAFTKDWYERTGILPDPVYTARLFRRALMHIRDGGWQGKRVLLVHSGGLQGWDGMATKVDSLGGQCDRAWLRQALQAEAQVTASA